MCVNCVVVLEMRPTYHPVGSVYLRIKYIHTGLIPRSVNGIACGGWSRKGVGSRLVGLGVQEGDVGGFERPGAVGVARVNVRRRQR